jgi:hypothetical protein
MLAGRPPYELVDGADPDDDEVVVEVAALAIVAPPTAAAPTAAPVASMDLIFLM